MKKSLTNYARSYSDQKCPNTGSVWRHYKTHKPYTVVCVTNTAGDNDRAAQAPMVVYIDAGSRVWSRPLSEWSDKFDKILESGHTSVEITATDLDRAHNLAMNNKQTLSKASHGACFYCESKFEHKHVTEWVDRGQTALCPTCGIDSVLASNEDIYLDGEFLRRMSQHFFSEIKFVEPSAPEFIEMDKLEQLRPNFNNQERRGPPRR